MEFFDLYFHLKKCLKAIYVYIYVYVCIYVESFINAQNCTFPLTPDSLECSRMTSN